jgi:hypothetical protein
MSDGFCLEGVVACSSFVRAEKPTRLPRLEWVLVSAVSTRSFPNDPAVNDAHLKSFCNLLCLFQSSTNTARDRTTTMPIKVPTHAHIMIIHSSIRSGRPKFGEIHIKKRKMDCKTDEDTRSADRLGSRYICILRIRGRYSCQEWHHFWTLDAIVGMSERILRICYYHPHAAILGPLWEAWILVTSS